MSDLLNPIKQEETILVGVSGEGLKRREKVYILETYLINPDPKGFLGLIVKTYGQLSSLGLNTSYEIVYGERGNTVPQYNKMVELLEIRAQILVRKKCKKGYKDKTRDLTLVIPAFQRSRKWSLDMRQVSTHLIKTRVSESNFKDKDIGKFVSIL